MTYQKIVGSSTARMMDKFRNFRVNVRSFKLRGDDSVDARTTTDRFVSIAR